MKIKNKETDIRKYKTVPSFVPTYEVLEEMSDTKNQRYITFNTQSECGDKFISCIRILLAVDPLEKMKMLEDF